jgi:HAD superfamily hydrolase (TIGR01549 family)
MHIILAKLNLDIGNDLQKIRKHFYKHFTKAAIEGRISPCVSLKPLYELKKDYPLIIISNSETVFLNASIKTLKIKGLFKKVYGAEKFSKKDVLLKKLFKKMKMKPSEAIYVGDRFSDIDFARTAGCIAVAIHNKCSWSTLTKIKKEKPDYIIKDFKDLKSLVKKLNA